MRLTIGSPVLSLTPGMRIVATSVSGIDNNKDNPEIDSMLTECWRTAGALRNEYPSPQLHPRIAPWRAALPTLGISAKKFPCSIESMVRRAFKADQPLRLNPLADFLHALSLRHLVPLGGFDATAIDGTLELRRTRDGDMFQALDSEGAVAVEPGEVAYAWQHHVLTRHFVWRQSAQALLTRETTEAIIVVELLPEIDELSTDLFVAELSEGLHNHFGKTTRPWVLDSDDRVADLAY